jgi:site-specific DNA-adenine methylase
MVLQKDFSKAPEKNREIMNEIISSCKEGLLKNILVLKDRVRDIFDNSTSIEEAYEKKNKLYFKG